MIEPLVYNPPTSPLNIIHRDEHLLLVDKPAGLLSVPGKAEAHRDCLEHRLRQAFPETLLVHRLDMDTSGIMVFALNSKAQRNLGLQFERRHVHKTYIARVWGRMKSDHGVVDLPLTADWPKRPLQKVCYENGRPARTNWRVIKRADTETRVQLSPETGRSHQLRVHMKEIGHHIVGDRFYGNGETGRLMLHSQSLSLVHPANGTRVEFTATCPF